jgi:hypothetical integral membrane protein (TIGR02206 family)
MNTAAAFKVFGSSHLTVLGSTIAVVALLLVLARRHGNLRAFDRGFGILLLGIFPANSVLQIWYQNWTLDTGLPLHLCDWAAILGGIALLWRKAWAAELTWFWGIAGTAQGLLTPDLKNDWPHPAFLGFFVLHCSVVVAAIYLAFGTPLHPRPGGAWRAFRAILGYAMVAGLVNSLAHTNYGYLREKPKIPTLLDAMGPWPVYIFGLIGMAGFLFVGLGLPFRRASNFSLKPEK